MQPSLASNPRLSCWMPCFEMSQPNSKVTVNLQKALVVLGLPVPMLIAASSLTSKPIAGLEHGRDRYSFNASYFPQSYHYHVYWKGQPCCPA